MPGPGAPAIESERMYISPASVPHSWVSTARARSLPVYPAVGYADPANPRLVATETDDGYTITGQATGKGRARWVARWKPALNAFAMTFEGRIILSKN